MDLFAAAGIDIGDGGRGGRPGRAAVPRTLKLPLLNHKVVAEARKLFNFELTPSQKAAAKSYAGTVRTASFAKRKETAVRTIFFEKVLGDILGYRQLEAESAFTLAIEYPIRGGSVDVALGQFGRNEIPDQIVAPFEFKGPDTKDLDAIMPGRGRSAVQQAWDYAIDAPGSKWVLVTNCVELRLYAFGRGRDAYELFDLRQLDDEHVLERLILLLSADQLLGGATEKLLRETDSAYKDITGKLYVDYKDLRDQLIAFLTDAVDGPKLAMLAAIEVAQKVLDRILFVAFAQRTDLLPDKLLEKAKTARNEFLPQPIWQNFQALFRAVDKGDSRLYIDEYNGGLFAADPIADGLIIPDPLAEKLADLGQWDYRSDVPVTVLGHIFEQSITDIEKLRAEARGEAAPKVSKSKRQGVVYTPEIVTRFLVERTIEITLEEHFAALLKKHGRPVVPRASRATIFSEREDAAQRAFWNDYLAELRAIRIVDPACGSGAFLVAAFDLLAREYRGVVELLATLKQEIDFDIFDEIVTRNLYGVDINAESVEITRLSLWLKTARAKHRLQNLEATIKVGDSLIDEAKWTDRPFSWREEFPEVFANGGFDVVIGNPPYVRMELIKPVKPYLEKTYVVAADRTDLYAYFFEKGVRLLKQGGRLGFISSSTFFRTGSGENLRVFLGDNVSVESVIDFGDLQIFEGVTTYPAILTLRKAEADDGTLWFLKIDDALPPDLGAVFVGKAQTMPRSRLGAGSWQLEDDALARLRDKIVAGRKTLGEVYGAPLRGIVTGFNEAFIIDTPTRDRLVKQDAKSAELLKPFLKGEDIKRWRVEPDGLFLINTPKGNVDIENYPAIRDWLLPFRPELEKRATKQEWWELQQAQLAYQPKFEAPKIAWPHFQQSRVFALDRNSYFLNNKCFFIPSDDAFLLALLNSRCLWFQFVSLARLKRGGYFEAEAQYIEQLRLPERPSKASLAIISQFALDCGRVAQQHLEIRTAVHRRIAGDLGAEHQKRRGNWNVSGLSISRRFALRSRRPSRPKFR
ncbi:N-6 DNA methylase [Rhodopseudomonas sp. HC1]|uniref:Eco57I restriction-modification methylase domain-containing protein n=1 Tax=Rhodopseudomonas infernalis TaxID=2897386 RepID=UPI001EE80F95|nr:N-6 DNA methylase [Rhodopseudomonas infernalis]MCG6206016.1 N-6 DNA methylase [Rhodopseudomonas infernalis]